MRAPERREVHRRRHVVLLQDRIGADLEVVEPVVERDGHAALGQVVAVQPLDRFAERENRALRAGQRGEPLVQHRDGHVEIRIPLVLIVTRDAVVAQDQQPLVSPSTVEQALLGACPAKNAERLAFESSKHMPRLFPVAIPFPTREPRALPTASPRRQSSASSLPRATAVSCYSASVSEDTVEPPPRAPRPCRARRQESQSPAHRTHPQTAFQLLQYRQRKQKRGDSPKTVAPFCCLLPLLRSARCCRRCGAAPGASIDR
jgi:hypothetical protein